MLKVSANPSFWAPVEISVPGEQKPQLVQIKFKHLDRDAAKAFIESVEGKTDLEILTQIIEDWKGVDTPYSESVLQQLLQNYPASGAEIYISYQRELVGSKRKN